MSFSVFAQSKLWAENSKLKTQGQASVDSTNDWAKQEASQRAEDELCLYLADNQSAGRGRGENKWIDAGAGTSLLSTWSLGLHFRPQPILAPAMGLSLFRAAHATWPDLNFSLKPPNDLYCCDRKVAGLLLESLQQGTKVRLILGLGLNVFAKPSASAAPVAGALSDFLSAERLSIRVWHSFLDRFLLEIVATLQESQTQLSPNQCASLRYAINRGPTQIKEVLSDGGLVLTDDQRIPWQTL